MSEVCLSAWARLVEPRAGDRVWVETAEGERQSMSATARNRYVYTPMVGGVTRAAQARACFALAGGAEGCTPWGSAAAIAPR
jgi:hypothetical protein